MKKRNFQERKAELNSLLDDAEAAAKAIFLSQAIAEGRRNVTVSLETVHRISLVCRALLKSNPPRIPDYRAISDGWAELYGKPIAAQTLKNTYRKSIKAWQAAYDELEDGRVRLLFDQNATRRSGFAELSIDVTIESQAAHIANLETRVKELQLEVNDLRNIAKKRSKLQYSIVKPTPAGISSSMTSNSEVLDLNPLRDWFKLTDKDGSLIRITDAGAELTQFARPGRTIMSRKVIDVLRTLSGLR